MKLLIEHYSRAWIAIVLAVSVVFAFSKMTYQGRQGVSAFLGNMMERVLYINSEKTGDAFDAYMQNNFPQICLKDSYHIRAGRETEIQDCFYAIDSEGCNLSVDILRGWNSLGEEIDLALSPTGTFCVQEPGRYWIMASATDKNGMQKDIIVQIFVNRE